MPTPLRLADAALLYLVTYSGAEPRCSYMALLYLPPMMVPDVKVSRVTGDGGVAVNQRHGPLLASTRGTYLPSPTAVSVPDT